jgi:hypothetical protein
VADSATASSALAQTFFRDRINLFSLRRVMAVFKRNRAEIG